MKTGITTLFFLVLIFLIASCSSSSEEPYPDFKKYTESPESYVEPPVISSKNGVLSTTFTAEPTKITVAGQTFESNVYNGMYLPPVLRVSPGDSINLKIVNNIGKAFLIDRYIPTNIHYHGMTISPKMPQDYPYLSIENKRTFLKGIPQELQPTAKDMCGYPKVSGEFNYRIKIPKAHPQGTHWYHPHAHGNAESAVMSGMSGVIVVEGLIKDHYRKLSGLKEKVMMLKDIRLPGASDTAALTKTLNGMVNPSISMRPGEWQLWRMCHIGANAFYKVHLEGHKFWILAQDGNMLEIPQEADTLFLAPSSRLCVVVQAVGTHGSYSMRSLAVDTGPQGDPNPEVVIATINVNGKNIPVSDQNQIKERLQQEADDLNAVQTTADAVEKMEITRERTITFSESSDGKTFFIDGKEFDTKRTDITVKLGDVERWTIKNVTEELHVFHIHQLDFLVTKIKGQTKDFEGLRDVIDVPYMENGVPGEVELIIPFTDPMIVGKFVYHCHILEHEDNGMMANIEVIE